MARLVWMLVALAACGRGRGGAAPPCPAVGAHVAKLAKSDALAHTSADGRMRTRAVTELGALADATTAICSEHGWPDEVRRCLTRAGSGDVLPSCVATLPAEQRRVGAP